LHVYLSLSASRPAVWILLGVGDFRPQTPGFNLPLLTSATNRSVHITEVGLVHVSTV